MNEEQELAALEAELAALEAAAEVKVEAALHELQAEEVPQPEPVAETPKPKKKKSPKAEDVKPTDVDPKAAAIRQYGAQRLAAMRASKGLR